MKTNNSPAKCCRCNGTGQTKGAKMYGNKCLACNGGGYGNNVFTVSKLQCLGGNASNSAWVEQIGSRFHALNEDEALDHARWIYGITASISRE